MGMDLYSYIGAYTKMPEIKQTVKSEVYRCPATDCKNYKKMDKSNTFCPSCGLLGETHTEVKEVMKIPSYYDFMDDNDLDVDTFIDTESALIPNGGDYGGMALFSDDNAEAQEWEIDEDDISSSKEAFKKEYKEFLKKFKNAYGVELKIYFGSVTYVM
jgi:hypothetical protein